MWLPIRSSLIHPPPILGMRSNQGDMLEEFVRRMLREMRVMILSVFLGEEFTEANKLREDTVRAFNAHMEVVCVLFRWDALSINIIRSSVFHQVEFSSQTCSGGEPNDIGFIVDSCAGDDSSRYLSV